MRPIVTVPRPVLLALAILFGAATTGYSIVWIVHVHNGIGLGTDVYWLPSHEAEVRDIESGSPAWQAGLRSGDRIVAVNGARLDNPTPFYGYPFYKFVMLGLKGDVVKLSVVRRGVLSPLTLTPSLIAFGSPSGPRGFALQLMGYYPVFFVVVGMLVLALRLEDRNAWLLALLFAGFICGAPLFEGWINPHLRGFAAWYKLSFGGLTAAIFAYFFLIFPASSPIDRRLPTLKKITLCLSAAYAIVLGLACLRAGGLSPIYSLFGWVSRKPLAWPLMLYTVGLYGLGFASLLWNSIRPASAEVRRKTRVILWGMLAGFGPLFVMFTASFLINFPIWNFPFWMLALGVISLSLMPLSFAYAVIKHRVLEIPVLIKRSARYLLVQRGFVLLQVLLSVAVTAFFAIIVSSLLGSGGRFSTPAGLTSGVIFGSALAIAGARIYNAVTQRIDKAFFRSSYDARQILETLLQKIRRAASRPALASLLESEITQAVHPKSLGIYLEAANGLLKLESTAGRSEFQPFLSPNLGILENLLRRGEPWELPPSGPDDDTEGETFAALRKVDTECLVPISETNIRMAGLIVLGNRLSEEPYSREDKRLLASVADQAGIALDNIRLAEEMAERMEAERRVVQEMEFAREVQARLLPRRLPPLRTLDYAGRCVQARQVGGDYYDFLELTPGRVALVLADIAGKGVSGALLMANLQANLRSQYALALDDLGRLLESVNRSFYENTADSNYATLFLGDYDDSSGRLRYVNCGHLPPALLRTGEQHQRTPHGQCPVEWLKPTCTVLGLFDTLECRMEEVLLAPDDVLLLYTDGVTEASTPSGDEFGESRLIETLHKHRDLPAGTLLEKIVTEVQQFSGAQADDITMVVAKRKCA